MYDSFYTSSDKINDFFQHMSYETPYQFEYVVHIKTSIGREDEAGGAEDLADVLGRSRPRANHVPSLRVAKVGAG